MVGAGEIDIIIILAKHLLCGKVHGNDVQTMIYIPVIAIINHFFLNIPRAFKYVAGRVGKCKCAVLSKRKTSFPERKTADTASQPGFIYFSDLPGTNNPVIIRFQKILTAAKK